MTEEVKRKRGRPKKGEEKERSQYFEPEKKRSGRQSSRVDAVKSQEAIKEDGGVHIYEDDGKHDAELANSDAEVAFEEEEGEIYEIIARESNKVIDAYRKKGVMFKENYVPKTDGTGGNIKKSSCTSDIVEAVCMLLAQGTPIRSIAKIEGMPSKSTIYSWLLNVAEFKELYAMSEHIYLMDMAAELVEIADEKHVVVETDENGITEVKFSAAQVSWQANRIKVRQWILERRLRNIYGNAPIVEQTINIGTASLEAFAAIGEQAMEQEDKLLDVVNERRLREGMPPINMNGETETVDAVIIEEKKD